MITYETLQKFAAIETCKKIIKEFEFGQCELSLVDLNEDEVIELAKEHKIHLFSPNIDSPYYWAVITLDNLRILIKSKINEKVSILKKEYNEKIKALETATVTNA